jgi:lipid II isoglutaminyl synthase (glutamine-hydrolysing)
MCFGDRFHDRKAQSGAAFTATPSVIDADEGIERASDESGWETVPVSATATRYATGAMVAGMGLLDITTVVESPRLIGRVVIDAHLAGENFRVVGFENHGGRTSLGPGATPLGKVRRGHGNNGGDGSEGAVQGNIVGTYLHGPLLPSNPALCDALLRAAFCRVGGGELAPLDDRLEVAAHNAAESRR